jgi:hypothetical protein
MRDGFEELGLLPLAHKHGPLEEFKHAPIELADCDVLLISCGLTKHERAVGLRLEDWPAGVRVRILGQMDGYFKAHPGREVRLLSTGVGDGACFMLVHHAPKKESGVGTSPPTESRDAA